MSQKPPGDQRKTVEDQQHSQSDLSLSHPMMMTNGDGKTLYVADKDFTKWEEHPLASE
jgi:hypothetical protein